MIRRVRLKANPANALKRSAGLKRGKRLNRQSTKRAKVAPQRAAMVRKVLEERPWCEACPRIATAFPEMAKPCDGRSQDVHEPHTRARGGSILDERNTVATCRYGHAVIHANPVLAESLGLLRNSWDAEGAA